MRNKLLLCLLYVFQFVLIVYMEDKNNPKSDDDDIQTIPLGDGLNIVRERKRRNFSKPEMPPSWGSRYRQLFHPAWMDYCDVYHCNDYHKPACGLNRKKMNFKWFQSMCHLILNNQCSTYRGFLKYDPVETKYCRAYVMFLRAGCPLTQDCPDELDPVCAMSLKDSHIVLFKNQCFMDAANCRNSTLQEYDEVFMDFCNRHGSKSNGRLRFG